MKAWMPGSHQNPEREACPLASGKGQVGTEGLLGERLREIEIQVAREAGRYLQQEVKSGKVT